MMLDQLNTHMLKKPRPNFENLIFIHLTHTEGFPSGSVVKIPLANAEDVGSIPGLGRSPGGQNGNPLQYSCLENLTDRGAWQATVHSVTKSWTQLSD